MESETRLQMIYLQTPIISVKNQLYSYVSNLNPPITLRPRARNEKSFWRDSRKRVLYNHVTQIARCFTVLVIGCAL